jgi:thioredoxin reductase
MSKGEVFLEQVRLLIIGGGGAGIATALAACEVRGKAPDRATGDVAGKTPDKATGAVAGDAPGKATGDVTGKATGNATGAVAGNMPGTAPGKAPGKPGLRAQDILIVERHPYLGGLLQQCLHAGFGIREYEGELNGPEFISPLIAELRSLGIPCKLNTSAIHIRQDRVVTLASEEGLTRVKTEALVIATGCRERPIGSLPVAGTRPSGIHTAGAAQKMVNVNGWDLGQDIVVLGSGDVGLIMAGRFASLGKTVPAVIEQEAQCGGLRVNKRRYLDRYGIPLMTNSRITHIHGDRRITGVDVEQAQADGTISRSHIDCDTLITSVGLIPEIDLLQGVTAHGEKPLPSWIHLAGNAREVRRYIEDVIDDGTAAGQAAISQLD